MAHPNLVRQVSAGEGVKPWLILGPFYQDLSAYVQGLTLFEKAGATVGRSALLEIIEEAQEILTSRPREGQTASWRGMSSRWSLVRKPEKYLSWGQYNISNHLGAAFLSTVLTPDAPGWHQLRLLVRITSCVVVVVNGKTVLDVTAQPGQSEFEYGFLAELTRGENVVTVGMFRLGRMAQIGCRLQVMDGDVLVGVPLSEGMSLDTRARLEAEVSSLRLARDVFYPEHEIGVSLNADKGPPADEVPSTAPSRMKTQLVQGESRVIREIVPTGAGLAVLCRGGDLEDDTYRIESTWPDAHGAPLTSVAFQVYKVTPRAAPQGYDQLDERKRLVLEHYADSVAHVSAERRSAWGIWGQVARYALGRYDEVDENTIRETCDFVAARKDCADFVIQGLLRLMVWDQVQNRLSSAIKAMMKDTVLSFKYWVDEPGDTVMYMGSENHRLLFHVAEWVAGQLFPTEEFTNSRQRGLYHATKGRMYIVEWLRQRGRFGFDEWHSNSYYPICIAPLMNVYDFAIDEDYKLRQMAGAVIDYMFYNLAADSLDGVLGTTHGRSYGIYVKYPDFEGTSATCWLLYGTGSLARGTSGMSPVLVATSKYRLPKILHDIANDKEAVVESRVRQGVLRGTAPHANFLVYRTPDYLLSGLQDHRKGEYESSTHVAQVTFRRAAPDQGADGIHPKVVVFWSCPHTDGEGSGLRPDYWSGHTTLPRVIQYRNVMSLTWRLSDLAWMSHCFWEQERMDEVRLEGNWAFARVGQGYVGIWSQHGYCVGEEGQYAGRELLCHAPENTWLVECGRGADWGSFDAFVKALASAEIQVGRETPGGADSIVYVSPSVGQFVTGWDVRPTVNGQPIWLHGYPLVDSPWAHSDFGSGELTVRYGDQEYEIWFNQ